MKVFVVEFILTSVVIAEDESDAYSVAEDEFREIAGDVRPDVSVEREVTEASHLPSGWDLKCLPYGGDGIARLSDILSPGEAK